MPFNTWHMRATDFIPKPTLSYCSAPTYSSDTRLNPFMPALTASVFRAVSAYPMETLLQVFAYSQTINALNDSSLTA
jgi:hypothetical protein